VSAYVLSAEAELDLDQIWEYIAADNFDAADRWIGKFLDAFEVLAGTPGAGHPRKDFTEYPVLFLDRRCLLHHLSRRSPAYRDRSCDAGLTRHP